MNSYNLAQRLFSFLKVKVLFGVFLGFTLVGYQSTAVATQRRMLNVSGRGDVLVGDNVLILGFILEGYETCKLLIRGIGPSLTGFPAGTTLANPTIQLFNSSNVELMFNDNWRDTQQLEIQNTGLAPTNNLESAMIVSLPPGAYTVVLNGMGGGMGIGVAEVYDINPGFPDNDHIRLANGSVRAHAEPGYAQEVLGVIFFGDGNRDVIFRGIGPSFMTKYWLKDPLTRLYEGGTQIFSNDNWGDLEPWRKNEVIAHNLAPTNSLESAMFVSLGDSNFTVTMEGVPNTSSGRAILEVWDFGPSPNPPSASPTPTPPTHIVWNNFGDQGGYFTNCGPPGYGSAELVSTNLLAATGSGQSKVSLTGDAVSGNQGWPYSSSTIDVFLYRGDNNALLDWHSIGLDQRGYLTSGTVYFPWSLGASSFWIRFQGHTGALCPNYDTLYLRSSLVESP